MPYTDDKRELLKLKQGIITESETIKEEPHSADKAHYEVKGFKKKIANFFYHYKWHVIVIAFFIAVVSFMAYSMITKERADVKVLMFSGDQQVSGSLYYKRHDMELALERYTADFDKNDYVHVDAYYINVIPEQDFNYLSANQTKLYAEVGLAEAQIFIADRKQLEEILGNQEESSGYENLSEIYPDDPHIVDKYYYQIKGSPFAETAMFVETCPDDLFMAVRSNDFQGYAKLDDKTLEYHRRALEVLDNIVNDNKVTETQEDE